MKEVSLTDQGSQGQQSIFQLEQVLQLIVLFFKDLKIICADAYTTTWIDPLIKFSGDISSKTVQT